MKRDETAPANVLDDDLLAFGGGKDLHVAADFASPVACVVDHASQVVVGMRRLVMEHRQPAGAGFDGHIGDVVGAAVPPTAPLEVLVRRVLRILNQQVDTAHELDQASVATMDEAPAQPATGARLLDPRAADEYSV